jgi:hypothetical protein
LSGTRQAGSRAGDIRAHADGSGNGVREPHSITDCGDCHRQEQCRGAREPGEIKGQQNQNGKQTEHRPRGYHPGQAKPLRETAGKEAADA